MMDELRRLLKSHDFLSRALEEHGNALNRVDADNLRRERERVFFELVNFTSSHPQVTLAQMRFLLSGLADLASDPEQADFLRLACQQTAERLANDMLQQDPTRLSLLALQATERGVGATAPSISPQEAWLLDSMADRAFVYDRDYRYVFTNKANAGFHRKAAADFVGRPSHTIVGDKCFKELTKPTLDKCFAGRSLAFAASHRVGTKMLVYAASVDPVRDARGDVVSAMIVCRDVTRYSVPADIVWPGPDD
jgi:PAS domain-containing protein